MADFAHFSAPVSAARIKANQKENSKRLRFFFKMHNPSKVVKVDQVSCVHSCLPSSTASSQPPPFLQHAQMLSKWAGREEELFRHIAEKYKDSPDAAYLKAKV